MRCISSILITSTLYREIRIHHYRIIDFRAVDKKKGIGKCNLLSRLKDKGTEIEKRSTDEIKLIKVYFLERDGLSKLITLI